MLTDALLRSVIRCADEPEDALSHNLLRLRMELRHTGVDERLVLYLTTTTERALRVPTLAQVRAHFSSLAQEGDGVAQAVVGRLDMLDPADPCLVEVAFHQALDAHKAELLTYGLSDLIQQTAQILTTGMTVTERSKESGKYEPVTYRGPEAAIQHLSRGVAGLRTSVRQGYADGNIREEAEKLASYIAQRKARGTGVLTGLRMIDKVHHGLQPGELCLVMGFPGHMKTTLCLNMVYHVAVHQRRNVAIVSLETPADKLRTTLYCMHAAHPKWRDRGAPTIDHTRLENGLLSSDQQRFFEAVVEDFATSPDYGAILYKEPSAAVTIDDIHAWAELRHHQTPLSLLVVDYLGLVDPDQKVFDRQQAGAGLNRVIRQAKLMAMSFAGVGLPVLSPHQANREGYAAAEKAGGRYTLSALANANEAERSTDVVYYTYLDDSLRATNELAVGNLKNRSGVVFTEQVRLFADPATRLICDTDPNVAARGLVEL